MLALIGLGNPGAEYAETRHNIGFMVVDVLAAGRRMRYAGGTGEFLYCPFHAGETEALLVKPMTYMNNSGLTVRRIAEELGIGTAGLLVIVDDFQLPLGSLRIRLGGSDGGHNGLRSIIEHLGTESFPRMRCGIGGASMPSDKSEMAGYVLSPFDRQEGPSVGELVGRAAEAARMAVTDGIGQALQRCNIRVS